MGHISFARAMSCSSDAVSYVSWKNVTGLRGDTLSEKPDWPNELKKLIQDNWEVGDTFRTGDVYGFMSHLEQRFPENNNIAASIRHTLQRLRDREVIEFIERGKYKRLE